MSRGKATSPVDWRTRPGGTGAAPAGRWPKRIVLTTLALGLLALLAYLLIPPRYPVTRFVFLPITQYNALLPAAPATLSDVATLKAAWAPDRSSELLEASGTWEAIRQIGSRLGDPPGGVLIVYASGLGVSDRGQAYLLCSDYIPEPHAATPPKTPPAAGDTPRTRQGPIAEKRYPVADLLAELASPQRKAKLKLLILDAPYVVSDARLGVLVNEFWRLVEQDVRKTQDPNLWVLASGQVFESAHVCPATQRSVLARFVEEALRRDADLEPNGNHDRVITLDELYRYVRDRLVLWSEQQCRWPDGQYPRLLWGGGPSPQTDDDIPANLALVVLMPGGKPETEPKEEAAKVQADGKPGADTAGPQAATGSGGIAPGAAGTGPSGWAVAAEVTGPPATSVGTKNPTQPASTGKASPADQANAAEEKSSSVGGTASSDQGRGGQASKAPAVVPELEQAQAQAQRLAFRNLLRQAWAQRDALAARSNRGQWSPCDYAPHLWRAFEEQLLGYEQRYRYGQPPGKMLAELADLVRPAGSAPAAGESFLGRLAAIEARVLGSPAAQSYAQLAEEDAIVERAVKLRNRVLWAAPYYVRWCGRLSYTSDQTPDWATVLGTDLLQARFRRLATLVEEFERGQPPADTTGAPRREMLRDLAEAVNQTQETLDTLEARLRRETQQVLDAVTSGNRRGMAARIEALLSTPLVRAEDRTRLLDAWESFSPELAEAVPRRTPPAPDPLRWRRLWEQAALEVQLLRVVEPDPPVQLPARNLLDGRTEKDEAARWEAFRDTGAQLRAFYEAIPARVAAELNAAQGPPESRGTPEPTHRKAAGSTGGADPESALPARPADSVGPAHAVGMHHAAGLLRLADARDASALDRLLGATVDRITLFAVYVPPRPQAFVKAPPTLELRRDGQWTPLNLEVGLAGAPPPELEAALTLAYPAAAVEIRDPGGKTLRPESPVRLILKQGSARVRLEARAKDPEHFDAGALSAILETAGQSARSAVQFHLARLEDVVLLMERLDTFSNARYEQRREKTLDGTGWVIPAEVFANRTTEFVFGLRHEAGRPRNVEVRLWTLPPWHRPGQARVSPLDEFGRVRPGFRLVAGPVRVSLAADNRPATLRLVPEPKPAAAIGPEGKESPDRPTPLGAKGAAAAPSAARPDDSSAVDAKAAAAPQAANAPASDARAQPGARGAEKAVGNGLSPAGAASAGGPLAGIDISSGLVCVVQEPAEGKSAAQPPDAPSSRKAWITWVDFKPVNPARYVTAAVRYVDGKIEIRAQAVRNSMYLPPFPIPIVWSNAGQYATNAPRVSSGKLTGLDQALTLFAEVPRSVGTAEVHLAVDGYPRALKYQVRTDRESIVVPPSRDMYRVRIARPREAAEKYLRVPMKNKLLVDMEVDAPDDAFSPEAGASGTPDVVQVWLSRMENSEPIGEGRKEFFGDRAVRVSLEGVSPQGPFQISATVSDLQAAFDVGDLQEKVKVRAKLALQRPPRTTEDAVDLVLDGDPPTIILEAPAAIALGEDLPVAAQATDRLSGVRKVEVGFDLAGTGHLRDDQVRATLEPPNLDRPVILPTKELKLNVGQDYTLVARATDYAGNTAETSHRFTIKPPAKEPGTMAQPMAPGTIVGTVTAEVGTPRGVAVEAEGLPPPELVGNSFTFKQVPPGTYTVRARGRAGPSSVERQGSRRVTVKSGETVTLQIPIE